MKRPRERTIQYSDNLSRLRMSRFPILHLAFLPIPIGQRFKNLDLVNGHDVRIKSKVLVPHHSF